MKFLYNLLLILALPIILATKGTGLEQEKIRFTTKSYCIARFDFCIDYPSDILTEGEKGDNDDGIFLSNDDKTISANVYGTFNVFNMDIEELLQMAIEDLSIDRSEVENGVINIGDNTYEFTIQTDEGVLYQKVLLYSDSFVAVDMKLSEKHKTILEQLIEEVRLEINL